MPVTTKDLYEKLEHFDSRVAFYGSVDDFLFTSKKLQKDSVITIKFPYATKHNVTAYEH